MLISGVRKLEIGSGDHPQGDYEQFDIRPLPHVDYVGDARNLPFEDETFDEVYSSQTLEHFSRRDTWHVLYEWLRVVKKEGKLVLQLPDIRGMLNDYYTGQHSWEHLVERLYGTQDYEGNTHYTMFTLDEFKKSLDKFELKYVNCYYIANMGGFHIEIIK